MTNIDEHHRSPQQITERLDRVIDDIRTRFHAAAIGKPKGSVKEPYDVLIVAHGHILRAFAARWIKKDIANNPSLILEAGGVGTLRSVCMPQLARLSAIADSLSRSYEHNSLDEPAILLGGAFMADLVGGPAGK